MAKNIEHKMVNANNPNTRKIELINALDGTTRLFFDDGVSKSGEPGQLRQIILAAIAKRRDGKPIFYAKEQYPPRFGGDVVSMIPVYGADAKAITAAKEPERKRKAAQAADLASAEKSKAKGGKS